MVYAEWVGKYIKYSNLKIRPRDFMKVALLLPIILLLFSVVVYFFFGLFASLIVIFIIVILESLLHLSLVIISNKRAELAEQMLPDALMLISSNLRAGIIPERAFIESARPEFGPLSEQIKEAGKAMILGEPVKSAFKKIPEKINSPLLVKTVNLISEGIEKGGNLAHLLEGLAEDIKSSLMLRKDIKAQVASYGMFIILALGIGAPLLYSSSLFLMETLISLGEILPTDALPASGVSLKLYSVTLSKEFLLNYSLILMAVSSFFGGILIGLIMEGKELAGVKYVPILIILDFLLFYIIKFVLLSSFAII